MNESLVIVMMGRPGSVKGTQAAMLAEELGLDILRTSKLLKERGETKDFTGEKIINWIDNGFFIPSTFTMHLMMKEFDARQDDLKKGFILDGFPRKLFEAYMLEEVLEWFGWDNVKFLNIVVSEEEVKERLLKRGRVDDDPEDIITRFRMHDERVKPALEYLKEKRIDINGEQSEEEVYAEIKEKLVL